MVVGTKTATKGFSFVEVLIAVVLMAMLMTSVAAAVHAALQSYRENELITSMTQSARSILTRMMRDVRTADEVDSTSTSLSILPPDDGSGVTLIQYELAGGTFYYRRTVGSTTTSEVLLAPGDQVSVDSFTVTRQTGIRDSLVYTESVTATITFTAGGRTFTVTASADPRRNQEY
jgi:prepilin-type N-terminal cleavage/methylation domain-containing protein